MFLPIFPVAVEQFGGKEISCIKLKIEPQYCLLFSHVNLESMYAVYIVAINKVERLSKEVQCIVNLGGIVSYKSQILSSDKSSIQEYVLILHLIS